MNHKVTSKEEILQKTLDIAMAEGIDNVSIRKLAKACGIGVGSMYNYYPDKKTLISAVSEHFWDIIMQDQEKIYRPGMGFTMFLEQYYIFLYSRLSQYDSSWLKKMQGSTKNEAINLFKQVLGEDSRVKEFIWNIELNQDTFCEYVLTNIVALLRAGENNCRFFVFLLEHLLYDV